MPASRGVAGISSAHFEELGFRSTSNRPEAGLIGRRSIGWVSIACIVESGETAHATRFGTLGHGHIASIRLGA